MKKVKICVIWFIAISFVFSSCTPEDDLPQEGIISEVFYPDDHGEWTGGTRYFPIRQVFVNCTPGSFIFYRNLAPRDTIWPGDTTSFSVVPMDTLLFESMIDSLNHVFAESDIQFYLGSNVFLTNSSGTGLSEPLDYDPNASDSKMINVYYTNFDGVSSNAAHLPSHARANVGRVRLSCSEILQLETIIHEFGHFFGLYHTFETGEYGGGGPELVDGSNCETAGDLVCDTPADCGRVKEKIFASDPDYVCNEKDANGDTYHPDMTNYMSYYKYQNHFTPGQYARMWDCSFLGSLDILVKGKKR